jgi:siroheme synthase
LTAQARAAIEHADVVLHLVTEPAARRWLESLNPRSRSLHELYRPGQERSETYEAITEEIVRHVRSGLDVCAAFYGHPGVFAASSHDAVARARAEGHDARMLPGITADGCLFADLGVDPSRFGCQSYDATELLARGHRIDATAALVLWQIGTVGNSLVATEARPVALPALVETLVDAYGAEHAAVVYEASPYPGLEPLVRRLELGELSPEHVTAMSTLYVPPRGD